MHNFGFVYTIQFWGLVEAATIASLSPSTISGCTTSGCEVVVNTVRDGVAQGTYLQRYLSPKSNQAFKVRVAAANAEGYGPASVIETVTTPAVGVVPGALRGVALMRHTNTSLRLLFEAPEHDGGGLSLGTTLNGMAPLPSIARARSTANGRGADPRVQDIITVPQQCHCSR